MGIDVLVVEKLDKLMTTRVRLVLMTRRCAPCSRSAGRECSAAHYTVARDAFSHPKGRCFADIQPMTDEFGWPRRTPLFSHRSMR